MGIPSIFSVFLRSITFPFVRGATKIAITFGENIVKGKDCRFRLAVDVETLNCKLIYLLVKGYS